MSIEAEHAGRGSWPDHDGRVGIDWLCIHCGYNLRTLPVDGRCPECGQPVADSRPLFACSALWLRRLRFAVVLLFLSLVAAAVVVPTYRHIVFMIYGPESPYWPQRIGETVSPNRPQVFGASLESIVKLLPRVVALAALLVFLLREPSAKRGNDPKRRRVARALVWVGLVWLVGNAALGMVTDGSKWVGIVLMVAHDMVLVAIILAVLAYVIHLSSLVPSRKLTVYGRILRWSLIPVALGWFAVDAAVAVVVTLAPSPIEAPYAFPAPTGGSTTTSPASTRAREYILVDESQAMMRTATAPAYMLERWNQFGSAVDRKQPKLSTAIDRYRAIQRYTFLPSVAWRLAALMYVGVLWWTLRQIIKQQRTASNSENTTTIA